MDNVNGIALTAKHFALSVLFCFVFKFHSFEEITCGSLFNPLL